jgi:hypothetical protein
MLGVCRRQCHQISSSPLSTHYSQKEEEEEETRRRRRLLYD